MKELRINGKLYREVKLVCKCGQDHSQPLVTWCDRSSTEIERDELRAENEELARENASLLLSAKSWAREAKIEAEVAKELKEENEIMRNALNSVDKFWFDPSDYSAGCCSMCDANLHENSIGVHQQLNGDPCPLQEVHEALEKVGGK